jgi:acetolactate synthase-1/2/3 large subunit
MGVDALGCDDGLRVGMIGTYGNRWANIALSRCDVLLVLGSRLDIRQTGSDVASFKRGRTIYHLDVDPAEVNNRLSGCRAVICSLEQAVPQLVDIARHGAPATHANWQAEVAELRRRWPDVRELPDISGINPNVLMHELSRQSPATAFVADVGQHQMWAAQSLQISRDQRFLTSGGLGAMGSGLPMAVGACVALEGPVALIAGDGGFQLNLQELQTVVRNELPLKLVILNNRAHGMVRQFQDSYFGGRYQSTVWGYSAPDFAAVAAAYGIASRAIEAPQDAAAAIEELWSAPGPGLLEVQIDPQANVYPKLAFGRPLSEMEPFAPPVALGG